MSEFVLVMVAKNNFKSQMFNGNKTHVIIKNKLPEFIVKNIVEIFHKINSNYNITLKCDIKLQKWNMQTNNKRLINKKNIESAEI